MLQSIDSHLTDTVTRSPSKRYLRRTHMLIRTTVTHGWSLSEVNHRFPGQRSGGHLADRMVPSLSKGNLRRKHVLIPTTVQATPLNDAHFYGISCGRCDATVPTTAMQQRGHESMALWSLIRYARRRPEGNFAKGGNLDISVL